MNNPMLGAVNMTRLSGMMRQLAPLKNAMQAAKAASDPAAFLRQMAESNPSVAEAMKLAQNANGDARAAFYALAGKLGVNGDEIMKMLNA